MKITIFIFILISIITIIFPTKETFSTFLCGETTVRIVERKPIFSLSSLTLNQDGGSCKLKSYGGNVLWMEMATKYEDAEVLSPL